MASTLFNPAATLIHANLGWLTAYRSFNAGRYYDLNRQAFGALRILNDDTLAGGRGFDMHPHQNMEILTLPLAGALAHADSLGHQNVIRTGEVQVMSAGTGIAHSEKNFSSHDPVHFLQIWLTTDQPDAAPRYDQQSYASIPHGFVQIASPEKGKDGVHLRQQAWLHMGTLTPGGATTYCIKRPGNGVYALVLQGEVHFNGQRVGMNDGFGIWDTNQLTVRAISPARVLLIDVPMQA